MRTIEELELELSPVQKKAAWLLVQNDLATNMKGEKKTLEEIASECAIDTKTLYNWRKTDRNFIDYKNSITDMTLDDFYSEAMAMLMKLVRGTSNNGMGSIKALELYLKTTGRLINRSEISTSEGERKSKRLTDAEVSDKLAELNEMLN
ncbi:phBC6A51 family helix-turn-helix protein [Heyndrickxia sp. MSNUG]|uniref:phBC6A51 family helix-turn-helix protein n=1 Tax=Heyndrickxia sp. MSNUG TaxID=3136677 RepID=UPI003C2CF833